MGVIIIIIIDYIDIIIIIFIVVVIIIISSSIVIIIIFTIPLAGYIRICPYVRSYIRSYVYQRRHRSTNFIHFLNNCHETSHRCSQTSSLVRV